VDLRSEFRVPFRRRAAKCYVVHFTITGGQSLTEAEGGSRYVPKKKLATGLPLPLRVCLETGLASPGQIGYCSRA
jgi:hypothetical protein